MRTPEPRGYFNTPMTLGQEIQYSSGRLWAKAGYALEAWPSYDPNSALCEIFVSGYRDTMKQLKESKGIPQS